MTQIKHKASPDTQPPILLACRACIDARCTRAAAALLTCPRKPAAYTSHTHEQPAQRNNRCKHLQEHRRASPLRGSPAAAGPVAAVAITPSASSQASSDHVLVLVQRDTICRVALKQQLLQRLRPAAQGRQKKAAAGVSEVCYMQTHHQLGRKGCVAPAKVGRGRARSRRSSEAPKIANWVAIQKANSQASCAGAQPPEPSFQYAGLTNARCWVEPQGPCIPASTHTSMGWRQLLRHQAGSLCLSPARCSLADATGTHSPHPLTCPALLCNSGQPASCNEARQEHLQEQQYT